MYDMQNILLAFALTLFAGLSTGIGSAISLFAKRTSKKFLSVSLGFSAGVMIYVSMIEIFVKAQHSLTSAFGAKNGLLFTIIAFFGGMAVIALIDKLIPDDQNPHHCLGSECSTDENHGHAHLMRTGTFTALAVAIHNFPEGLATFISALEDPAVAIPVVVAIAIHNIPEGIAVAMPIYYATGDKKKAFLYSFLSGLSEPIGALIGFLVLLPFMNDAVYGILFAAVAGIMVFISFDELLPAAEEYGEHHLSIYGLIGGMLVMAVSLWMFL